MKKYTVCFYNHETGDGDMFQCEATDRADAVNRALAYHDCAVEQGYIVAVLAGHHEDVTRYS